MNNFYLTNIEITVLILLIFFLILPFKLIDKNYKLTIAHPLVFYSLIMVYYTVFCPVLQIFYNQTTSRGLDFREQYILGWVGALISVISVLIGYSSNIKIKKRVNKCDLNYESLWTIGLYLSIVGLLIFLVFSGFNISYFNPFFNPSLTFDFLYYKGAYRNYFISFQNFMISGNFLMFAAAYSIKKKFPITLFNLLISTSCFLNTGFRYRILFLFGSIIFFLLIKEDKVKNTLAIKIGSFASIAILFGMTILGQVRTYGQGLNFENFNLMFNYFEYLISQGESALFITTSGLINLIPETLPFENFYPLIKTLIHPLPSALFDKGSGDYLFKVLDGIYGFKQNSQGAAYLNYGEYYLMFGWFGIFIFNFLFGYLLKRLWSWVNVHKEEPLAILLFILNVIFIFIVISRGYLPQQVNLYFFTVFPIFAIYFLNSKSKLNTN